jgi:hypothetical protein
MAQLLAQMNKIVQDSAELRAEIAARDAAAAARATEAAAQVEALRGEIAASAARDAAAAAQVEAMRAEIAAAAARDAAQVEAMRAEIAAAAARDAAAAAQVEAMRVEIAAAAARDAAAAAQVETLHVEIAAAAARTEAQIAAASRVGGSPLSPSYAAVGDTALHTLTSARRIFHLQPPPDGASDDEKAPVAAPEDLGRLLACTLERDLVKTITPLLRAARGLDVAPEPSPADPCPLVLVNSEGVAWLDALSPAQPADQLKRPDLFVTWAPFWSGLHTSERGAVGRLAARALQLDGCVRELYEAKRGAGELTSADFGQLVDYHSRLPEKVDGVPTLTRGVLFNARVFWLYESVSAHPVTLTKGSWGAPGSRAALRAFFNAAPEPSAVPLLRFMCGRLGVVPRRIAATDAQPAAAAAAAAAADGAATTRHPPLSAFLGAGASGQVFCVARPPAAGDAAAAAAEAAELPYALKVSSTSSRAVLTYEFETLAQAFEAGAPVVPVVAGSLHFLHTGAEGVYRGGGFLLRDVCARTHVDSRARCVAAFAALHALHAKGFAHGDARLPNLVIRGHGAGAELVWIDMRSAFSGAFLGFSQRTDGRTLAASVLGIGQGGVLPGPVCTALEGVPDGGGAAYNALAAAVWEARPA